MKRARDAAPVRSDAWDPWCGEPARPGDYTAWIERTLAAKKWSEKPSEFKPHPISEPREIAMKIRLRPEATP